MRANGPICLLLVLLVLGGSAHAGRDMDYVDGLSARGYYLLAIEHLQEMQRRADVPEQDKILVPLSLGGVYNALALREPDAQQKEHHLAEASRHLEEFATKNPTHPKILDVNLQHVDILSSRAQAMEMWFRAETNADKKESLRKQAEELYKKGLDAAKVIVEKAGEKAKQLRPKAAQNKRFLKEYWTYYGAEVRGMFLLGHLEYLWAQLFDEKDAERKKHLEAAEKHFKETTTKRPKTNVTFDAHVRRGMCLRELAVFAKSAKDAQKMRGDALTALEEALTVQSTPQTRSTRAEAYYQKAVTAHELGDYEAAVSASEGFLRETPQGKNSYRGQETLLLMARSLGKVAEVQYNRKEEGWKNTYDEARTAVKDVLPDFAEIREAADKLVQDWGNVFPIREVVISPFIAAAQAKKLYADGRLDEAIEKYREVITLSGDREEYVDFAQEAWKTIGKIYYDTRRLYMATIAWRELLARFPQTYQAAEIAWVRTRVFRYLYSQGGQDEFDLDEYLDSLAFFVEKSPKDPRVFDAQTESADVHAIRGEILKAAAIWAKTDPENARYAESMLKSGELYRQAFINLVEVAKGDTAEAKQRFAGCVKHLRLAADAKLPPDAAENYNAQALARLAEVLADAAAPAGSAAKVPPIVLEYRRRFGDEKEMTPRVLLAGAQAYAALKQPDDAEKLAFAIEKEFPRSYAYESVKQLMIVVFQKTNPAKANAWQQKQFRGDYDGADDISLETLGNRAWQQKNYEVAAKCFETLEKRYRTKDREKHRDYKESLGAVYFEAGEYGKATPLYREFLKEAREAFKTSETAENRNTLLLAMRRLAQSEEMGGDAGKGVSLWNEFAGMVFAPDPPKEWFEARYHLANSYFRQGKENAARDIIRRVEVLYGGWGEDLELATKVAELKKELGVK